MIRGRRLLLAVLLTGGVHSPVWPAVPLDVKAATLERSIDTAAEQGRIDQVEVFRLQLADRYVELKQIPEAIRQFELLLASRPSKTKRVRYFTRLGQLQDHIGDYGRAISSFQDALHDDPKDWDANVSLAGTYVHSELYTKALEVYQKCLKMRPAARSVYQAMASVYQHLGYFNKAIPFYEKALRLEPRPEIYLGIADCYVLQDNIPKATEVLQQAKSILPRADYDVRLGEIYQKQGRLTEAAGAWEEALKIDGARDDVKLRLAMTYDLLHRPAEADRLFKGLLAAYPESPLVHYLRALVLYDRGESEASKAEVRIVQRLAPTELVRYYNERLLLQIK